MGETESQGGNAHFRLAPDVKQALAEYAAANRRTLNSAVNYLLSQALIPDSKEEPECESQ